MKHAIILLLLVTMGLGLFAQDQGTLPEDGEGTDESEMTFDFDSQAQEGEELTVEAPRLGFGDFIRMFFILAVVIALIYLFFWFLRRLSGQNANPQEIVNLVATQNLKGDQTLYLVEVGQELLLIGGTSNSLNLIKEIQDKETQDQMKLRASQQSSGSGKSFFQSLKEQIFPVSSANSKEDGSTTWKTPTLKRHKDRLKEL